MPQPSRYAAARYARHATRALATLVIHCPWYVLPAKDAARAVKVHHHRTSRDGQDASCFAATEEYMAENNRICHSVTVLVVSFDNNTPRFASQPLQPPVWPSMAEVSTPRPRIRCARAVWHEAASFVAPTSSLRAAAAQLLHRALE